MSGRRQRAPVAVVGSVAAGSLEDARRGIADAPAGCALVELRADRMSPDAIEAAVGSASRPVIVTVRHPAHGGAWDGSESERVAVLERALRAGARYVDVEVGTEAARLCATLPDRTIVSDHTVACDPAATCAAARRLAATPAARLKLVTDARRPGEARAVRAAYAAVPESGRLAAFASGPGGTWSRILCGLWGAWGTYGAVRPAAPTAVGQTTAADLLGVYRVTAIGDATARYALIGGDVSGSPSPALHAAGYRAAGLDAVYLPVSAPDPDDAFAVLDDRDAVAAAGFGVTMPFKEIAASRCRADGDPVASSSGAVNTVVGPPGRRVGSNTDGPAAVRLIRRHVSLSGAAISIAGAGGTARAIAAASRAAGARITLHARHPERVAAAVRRLGVALAPWCDLEASSWDVLVNATPLGRRRERVVPARALTGRLVLDAVYGPRSTPLVLDARSRGLAVEDGVALLVEQGVDQFAALTGRSAARAAMAAAVMQWQSGRVG